MAYDIILSSDNPALSLDYLETYLFCICFSWLVKTPHSNRHLSTPPNSLCTILLGCVVRCSESAFLHPHYDDGSWSILQFSIPTQVFPTVQCQGRNILNLKKFIYCTSLALLILYLRNVWYCTLWGLTWFHYSHVKWGPPPKGPHCWKRITKYRGIR